MYFPFHSFFSITYASSIIIISSICAIFDELFFSQSWDHIREDDRSESFFIINGMSNAFIDNGKFDDVEFQIKDFIVWYRLEIIINKVRVSDKISVMNIYLYIYLIFNIRIFCFYPVWFFTVLNSLKPSLLEHHTIKSYYRIFLFWE